MLCKLTDGQMLGETKTIVSILGVTCGPLLANHIQVNGTSYQAQNRVVEGVHRKGEVRRTNLEPVKEGGAGRTVRAICETILREREAWLCSPALWDSYLPCHLHPSQ